MKVLCSKINHTTCVPHTKVNSRSQEKKQTHVTLERLQLSILLPVCLSLCVPSPLHCFSFFYLQRKHLCKVYIRKNCIFLCSLHILMPEFLSETTHLPIGRHFCCLCCCCSCLSIASFEHVFFFPVAASII